MTDVLLTLYCAAADGHLVAQHLRDATGRAVHLREEIVLGRDFSDASTAERVLGQLDRRAIDVLLPEEQVGEALAGIEALRRAAPIRWQAMPVLSAGRLP